MALALPGWVGSARADAAAPGERREAVVAVTSGLAGGLSTSVWGDGAAPDGLAHLAPRLTALRGAHPGLILLDAGDALTGAPWAPAGSALAGPPILLRAMNRLDYDAAVPGERDLARAGAFLGGWAAASRFPWLAADLAPGPARVLPYRILEHAGLKIAVLGLAMPGVAAQRALRSAGVSALAPLEAAAQRLAELRASGQADLVFGLVPGGWDAAADRDTARALGLLPRLDADVLADRLPLDLLIVGRAPLRPAPHAGAADSVPVAAAGAGLTVLRLTLERRADVWSVAEVNRERLPPLPAPDPVLMEEARADLSATAAWLGQPSRVRVTGSARKRAVLECAGALGHAAALRAGSPSPALGAARGEAAFSLLPELWRVLPLRKRDRGRVITRAQVYRWLPYDDELVLARLTGRQIALLLTPHVRNLRGWRIAPSLVLFPGGLEPHIPAGGSEVTSLTAPGAARPLSPHDLYPVWMTDYHWDGAGGLARSALLHPSQLAARGGISLREALFALLSLPAPALPGPCSGFLGVMEPDAGR
jgi:2',3'-cyclic-nucleotide 2'-phosphodiesterase (5'-nucleotidase family)